MLTKISSATLRRLVKLSERKDTLLAKVQKIDREIAAIQKKAIAAHEVEKAPVSVSRPKARSRKRRRR